MKTKDFKELCAVYTANPNLDNENVLLRTMVFDTKYYVATIKYEKGNALRMLQSETGSIVLCVYTNEAEVGAEITEKYELVKMTFDELYDNVNVNNVEYVLINPNTEALTLTCAQISKLYREKYYSDSSFPLHLDKDVEFKTRALKVSELNSQATSKKLIDIYLTAANEKEEEVRSKLLVEFVEELTNHAKFYTPVLPDGEVDKIGNLVVGKERVLFLTEDNIKGEYYLFVDANKIVETLKVDPENTYVSVFDFDDYVAMMDATRGVIKGLKIIGDTTITIPTSDIYYYNAIKEHNALTKDITVLKGSYAPSEETDLMEKELDELFVKYPAVEKAWLGREIELYKNNKNSYVYNVVLKLTSEEINKDAVKENVRKILGNKLYRMYITNDGNVDSQLKLVYERNMERIAKLEEEKKAKAEQKEKVVETNVEEVKPKATKKATTTAKKTATTKKAPAKKETTAKKPAVKKTTTKKVEEKPVAKKPAATKKATTAKTATKKTTAAKKVTTKKVEKK